MVSLLLNLNIFFFKPFSTVAIVDFEQVNSWWAGKNNIQILNVTQK